MKKVDYPIVDNLIVDNSIFIFGPDRWEEGLEMINRDFWPWRNDPEYAFSQLAHPEEHFLPGYGPDHKPPVV